MAIIKQPTGDDSPVNYIATLAFFCCVSCVVMLFKFRGFRASLDLMSLKKKEDELAPTVSLTGAYRINRDEFYGQGRTYEPPKKLTPSMVKLPPSANPESALRPTKSTSDLQRPPNIPPQLQQHKSTHDVSRDPRGAPSRPVSSDPPAPTRPARKKLCDTPEEKEQKRQEKQRLAQEKARAKAAAQEQAKQEKLRRDREKAAAQEQAKQEKLRREREKKAAQEQAKAMKMNKKRNQAPVPPQAQGNVAVASNIPPPPPPPGPLPQQIPQNLIPPQASRQARQANSTYSTNTMDSSISKSSGPPPYSETPAVLPATASNSKPGDVSFSKPVDATPDSWDLISQHRQQMSRPVVNAAPRDARKNMVMDLQYKLGPTNDKDNSEA